MKPVLPEWPSALRATGRVVATSVFRGDEGESRDLLAVEEPLEIRVAGEPLAVLMRTPGEDHRLTLGFLFAERIIASASDVAGIFHCGKPGVEGSGNVVEVAPASGGRMDWTRLDGARRSFVSGSACGLCGRQVVADLLADTDSLPDGPILPAPAIGDAVAALRDHQPAFAATGGTHAAALWGRDGALVAAHEDVGRHNAVDKVVGALLLAREQARARGTAPPEPALLAVSSRTGLEVLQKAVRARIPIVASVSAPTSLAVDFARRAGVTLAAFVRAGRMNVYARHERIAHEVARGAPITPLT